MIFKKQDIEKKDSENYSVLLLNHAEKKSECQGEKRKNISNADDFMVV